jgi:hypothetical protein
MGRIYLHTGPRKDQQFHNYALASNKKALKHKSLHRRTLDGGTSSPPAMWGQMWATNELGMRPGSPQTDWRWWDGRILHRWAAAAEQWRHVRLGSKSGEERGSAKQCWAWGAAAGYREGLSMLRWHWERAGKGARWRRQWRVTTGSAHARRSGRQPFIGAGELERR